MGLSYQMVLWNRQKKNYDRTIVWLILGYLLVFAGLTIGLNGNTSLETLIIRAFGSLAILMLHVILIIGPLARLNEKFLPLLYNRRHLGVSMFLMSAIHGVFAIIQFHTLGDTNPLVSLFTSNMDYTSLTNFPFQVLGFFGLIILFLMAATSHDFWLANLGPKTWKSLHMLVYVAYAVIILHVFLGAFQQETSPVLLATVGLGMMVVISLHLLAGSKETSRDREKQLVDNGWQLVGEVSDIKEDRAKMVCCNGERIAVFKYDNQLSAVSNVCKHQNGPLSEGKIIDGCITCPWHGYQYHPGNGQAPAPFKEKIATYRLKLEGTKVFVDPNALPEGTEVEPVKLNV